MKKTFVLMFFLAGAVSVTACQSRFSMPASNTSSSTGGVPGQVLLTWNAVNGEQDGFYVEQSADGVNFTQIQTVPDGVNSVTIMNVAAGKTYYYRVRGYNQAGKSPYSTTASVRK